MEINMKLNTEAIIGFIKERSVEPSTWRGLVNILTAAGIVIEPSFVEPIIALGLGLSGLIGALTKDKVKV